MLNELLPLARRPYVLCSVAAAAGISIPKSLRYTFAFFLHTCCLSGAAVIAWPDLFVITFVNTI
jgi:hypothetical protein